eukprot:CAMPEP_0178399270 /NCGR_PEP_ID=MMETSP0689_2-20121128/15195_1 /TAXON_ID=160604 /ORGANISM="Amphidinium massartii, Strain CS-259" /LENGTH=742 /DNA_ID=CAMNT_0020020045 /DNA_START=44 /DNA_END=2272 /DNA_ORIENTATION=+
MQQQAVDASRCDSKESLLPRAGVSELSTAVPSCISDCDLNSLQADCAVIQRGGVQIICVGLMRTGLKTLHEALKVLGHSQIYDQEQITSTYELWNDVMENRCTETTFTNIFQGAKVVMGMPVFCFWEEILQEYPNAKVILTVRDEDEWLESVERAKAHMDHDLPGVPLTAGSFLRRVERFLVPSYHKFCEVLRFSWSSSLGMLDTQLNRCCVLNNYRKHNHYVETMLGDRSTLEGHPQLLVYDVRDGWEPLCEFLQQDVPKTEFPTVMNVPYFGKEPAGPDGMRLDRGGEFHDILVPDSPFGMRLRSELRKGLAISLLALVVIMAPVVLAVQQLHLITVSPMALTLIFLVLSCVGWNVYIVMHTLVMRVPAAVVLPMAMKSLLIAASLHACYISYGILKEQIVTQDKIASPVLILATRLMSVVCAAVAMFVTEGKISMEGPPIHHFLAFGLSNELSTWAGYAVLNYVSFPVQIMAKSCKMLPSMLMGRILNKTHYRLAQYLQAVGAMVCVTVMHLSEEGASKPSPGSSASEEEDGDHRRLINAMLGISLLGVFFVADGFTSQWQTALYKKHPELTQTKMMFMGNLFGTLITLASIASRWTAVSKSLGVACQNPEILGRIVLLGLSGAMGQFCIYTAIKMLGSLAFTWIMTARQLLSVLISLVLFGHGVSPLKLVCIITVFAIMSAKQLSRALPHAVQAVHVSVKTASAITRSLSTASWDLQPLRRSSTKSISGESCSSAKLD